MYKKIKMEELPNDTFLADWLAGKINDDQLKQLVSDTDFEAFQTLRNSLKKMQVSEPDMDKNYAAVKAKRIAANDKKPSRFLPFYGYAAAAILVLFIGLYQTFVFSNSIKTGYGNLESIALPDDSRVTLNAKSSVDFPNFFQCNRTVRLNGEAYFEVEKGSTFTVETPQGNVKVLGTKFNVISRPGFFEVACYEGKVKVMANDQSVILTVGNSIRFYDSQSEKWDNSADRKPLWLDGESAFRNVPLQFVLAQFETQYDREVVFPSAYGQIKFSGSFTNKDENIALQSICIPMKLKYRKTSTGKIVISE